MSLAKPASYPLKVFPKSNYPINKRIESPAPSATPISPTECKQSLVLSPKMAPSNRRKPVFQDAAHEQKESIKEYPSPNGSPRTLFYPHRIAVLGNNIKQRTQSQGSLSS